MSANVAIVTGGSGGIGRAVARSFVDAGLTVGLLDLDVTGSQRKTNDGTLRVPCDVTDESSVHKALGTVCARLGTPRVLVNSAGVSPTRRMPLQNTALSDWQHTLAVNATGTYLASREFVKRFEADPVPGGRIVNILSTASLIGFAGMLAYCASKGAALMLTRTLAIELASLGITVNGVAPGTIETNMTTAFRDATPEPQRIAIVRHDNDRTPLGRRGGTADVAAAVLYLASEDARWVTGEVLTVDGGFMATGCPAYTDDGGLPQTER